MWVYLLTVLLIATGYAQNVGINTATPDPTSVLDVNSNERGVLLPRLTTVQRDAIATPAEGLEIYNLDSHCKEFYNGTSWISLCATVAPCSPPPASTPGSNSPICTGEDLNLTATAVVGATYVWTGPNSFTSTAQNPTVSSVTLDDTGTYRLRTWLLGCYSDETTADVAINPFPYTQRTDFPGTARTSSQLFSVGNDIYVVGGMTAWCTGFQATSYRYTPATDTWSAIANHPINHAGGAAFSDGTNGFSLGGSVNCAGTSGTVTRYNVGSNTWTTGVSTMTVPVHGASGTYQPQEDTLFLLGGKTGDGSTCGEYTGVLRKYTASTNIWTTLAALPTTRGWPVLTMIGGRMFGGMGSKWTGCATNYTDWYEYDFGANSWSARTSFPGNGGAKYAYFELGGLCYVLDSDRTLYSYDPATDSWTALPCKLPTGASIAAAMGGKGYFFNTSNKQTWEFTP